MCKLIYSNMQKQFSFYCSVWSFKIIDDQFNSSSTFFSPFQAANKKSLCDLCMFLLQFLLFTVTILSLRSCIHNIFFTDMCSQDSHCSHVFTVVFAVTCSQYNLCGHVLTNIIFAITCSPYRLYGHVLTTQSLRSCAQNVVFMVTCLQYSLYGHVFTMQSLWSRVHNIVFTLTCLQYSLTVIMCS